MIGQLLKTMLMRQAVGGVTRTHGPGIGMALGAALASPKLRKAGLLGLGALMAYNHFSKSRRPAGSTAAGTVPGAGAVPGTGAVSGGGAGPGGQG